MKEPTNMTAPQKKTRRPPMTPDKKAEAVLQHMSSLGTNIGEFLFVISNWRDEPGRSIRHSQGHGVTMRKFLNGEGVSYKPMQIIEQWFTHPGGRILDGSDDKKSMFSLETPYAEASNVRVGLTSMAAQLVQRELKREQREAVKGENGLHGSGEGKHGRRVLSWKDINAKTMPTVQGILRKHQPLAWSLLLSLAQHKPRKRTMNSNGAVRAVKQLVRPPEVVCRVLHTA